MRILLLFLLVILISPVYAQEAPPIPSQHPSIELEQQRKEREAKKAELEVKAKKTESDLKDTQAELVAIAKKIKKNEADLIALDKRISQNRKEKEEIEARLKKDKASIGDLVLALERLERTPPEAVLARPGAPLETAQSAMLLQSILPNIYGRAESLRKDLSRLEIVLKQLAEDQSKVKATGEDLAKRQEEMAGLLTKRKELYAETQSGIKTQDRELREIAAKAESLKELVAKIEERERQAREEERTRAALPSDDEAALRPAVARSTPLPKPGASQLPITGIIRVGFGQTDDIGAQSHGLNIEGRSGSLVVAPMGGVVRYAGSFKNYGRIIIVEHQKDYHSLIAGLARIDTVVGQSVSAGEPVGILGKSSGGDNPRLYYELRYQGQPVNPSRKFAGL
jgi:murein hydrolase activator